MVSPIFATLVAALLVLAPSFAQGQNYTLGSVMTTPGCTDNCPITIRWGREGAVMNFEIILDGPNAEWVGIGFTDSASMPKSDVLTAYINSVGAVDVVNGYCSERDEPERDASQSGISNVSGSRNATHFVARFSRTLAPINGNDASFLQGAASKYIIFAYGEGNVDEHSANGSPDGPILSTAPVDLRSTAPVLSMAATKARLETLAHGVFMMLGWILLAPSATFIAHTMRFNAPLWFKLHQYMQYAAVACTIIGAIIIAASGGESEGNPHGAFGVIMVILCILQALMGAFRNYISGKSKDSTDPTDKGPRRHIFNYLHWIVGGVLLILGAITMYFGLDLYGGDDAKETVLFIWMGVDAFAAIVAFLFNKEPYKRVIHVFASIYIVLNVAAIAVIGAIAHMDIPQ